MVAQFYTFILNNWIVPLKWVNFMVCKLYLNKVIKIIG